MIRNTLQAKAVLDRLKAEQAKYLYRYEELTEQGKKALEATYQEYSIVHRLLLKLQEAESIQKELKAFQEKN